jgi:hypothetical protein
MALPKEYIYEPIAISVGDANILMLGATEKLVAQKGSTVIVKWDLLNPREKIGINLFTDNPVNVSVTHKIREVSQVKFINELFDPPRVNRIKALGLLWLALLIASILMFFDAVMLVRWDAKLGAIFALTKELKTAVSVDKKVYLDELLNLYSDYYKSAFLLVKPEDVVSSVANKLESIDPISGRYLEIARVETINQVRYANLYSIRSMNIFIGPLIFGFCLIRILVALVFAV